MEAKQQVMWREVRAAPTSELHQRIKALAGWNRRDLVAEWTRLLGQAPPKYSSPQFMIRVIAYHWQEEALGGLSRATQREVKRLMKQYQRSPAQLIPKPTQIKAGTIVRRLWQGRMYEAEATEGGFLYQGKKFNSLSQIAREITGTRWNGQAFFGLRKVKEAA